jgi:dihydrofolate reductase
LVAAHVGAASTFWPRVDCYHGRMKPLHNLSIIVAMADNGVIGRDNALPWRLPADLARFKRLTMGKPIVMGRKTWESLPGLLPHRTHVVITRTTDYRADGALVVHSLDQALAHVADVDEVMVIGGAEIYRQALPLACRLYLTRVHADVDGDARFPPFDPADWHEAWQEPHPSDERNDHSYTFVDLERC